MGRWSGYETLCLGKSQALICKYRILDIIDMLPTQAALLQVQNSGPSQMPIHEMPKTLPIAKTFTKQHKLRKVLEKVCIVSNNMCTRLRLSLIGFRLVDFFSEKIIAGPHWVPDPPSLAQMTFIQCTSMSELEIDPGAPPGGQI